MGPLLAQDQTYSNALAHTQPWPKPERNRAFLGLYIKKVCDLIGQSAVVVVVVVRRPHVPRPWNVPVVGFTISFFFLFDFVRRRRGQVLVQLNLTLVTKSDAYGDASLRSVFRLNNSHYLLSALQRSGLLHLLQVAFFFFWGGGYSSASVQNSLSATTPQVVHTLTDQFCVRFQVVEPDCDTIYREMMTEQKRLYSQRWTPLQNLPRRWKPYLTLAWFFFISLPAGTRFSRRSGTRKTCPRRCWRRVGCAKRTRPSSKKNFGCVQST